MLDRCLSATDWVRETGALLVVLRHPVCLGLLFRLVDLITLEGRRKNEERLAANGEAFWFVLYMTGGVEKDHCD